MTKHELLKIALEMGYQQALDEAEGMEKTAIPASLEALIRFPEALPRLLRKAPEQVRQVPRRAITQLERPTLRPIEPYGPAQQMGPRRPVPTPAPALQPAGPSEFAQYQATRTPESIGFQRMRSAPADMVPAEIPGQRPVQIEGPRYSQGVAGVRHARGAGQQAAELAPARPTTAKAAPKETKLQAPAAEEEAALRAGQDAQTEGWRWSQSAAPKPAPVQPRARLEPAPPATPEQMAAVPNLAPATDAGGNFVPVRDVAPVKKKPAAKLEAAAPAPAAPAPAAPAPAAPAPAAPAAPAEAAKAAPAMTDAQVAEEIQKAHQITDPVAYTERMKQLREGYGKQLDAVAGKGAVNPLLSWGAPIALPAGVGYMMGDEQGAAAGAGLGLGARLGAGPALRRIAESRGAAQALGKKMPSLGKAFQSLPPEEMTKALALSGGLGLGGGVGGYYLGKQKEKEPWYNQLMGLTPAIASAAVPYMMMKGSNPQLISQMQQLQGLQPASPDMSQMQQGMV